MIRYCLEIGSEGTVIHRVDCSSYDLGTLLGLGCVADLGEFKSAGQALDSIKHSHPDAVRCLACCKAEVLFLPQLAQPALPKAITLPSG
jgi:hypothetical protein